MNRVPTDTPNPLLIEEYYRKAPLGDVAIIRHTQGGLLRFDISRIESRNPRSGRIVVKGHGSFYMKSGKHCYHPKGQTYLVPPTSELLQWIEAHPMGEHLWFGRGH